MPTRARRLPARTRGKDTLALLSHRSIWPVLLTHTRARPRHGLCHGRRAGERRPLFSSNVSEGKWRQERHAHGGSSREGESSVEKEDLAVFEAAAAGKPPRVRYT